MCPAAHLTLWGTMAPSQWSSMTVPPLDVTNCWNAPQAAFGPSPAHSLQIPCPLSTPEGHGAHSWPLEQITRWGVCDPFQTSSRTTPPSRSEEHTSDLQSLLPT